MLACAMPSSNLLVKQFTPASHKAIQITISPWRAERLCRPDRRETSGFPANAAPSLIGLLS
jgi:hypothetical protein